MLTCSFDKSTCILSVKWGDKRKECEWYGKYACHLHIMPVQGVFGPQNVYYYADISMYSKKEHMCKTS